MDAPSHPAQASDPQSLQPFGDSHGPMLTGAYAPIFDESVFENLPVVGEVPRDLHGAYFRNGPNPRFEPTGKFHPFDGDAMVHAAYFDGGQVQVRNRWIRTEAFLEEERAHQTLFTGIIHTIKESPVKRLKDNANTDLQMFNGELLATWYMSGAVYRVDPLTLETLGKLPASLGNISAHSKTDPRNGDFVFFDYGTEQPYMRFGVLAANGAVKKLVDVDLPGARMPHDMALTEQYGILHDHPLIRDPQAAQLGRHKLNYESRLGTRFGVISREGDAAPMWFTFEPCFCYHVINAWEEGDEVVLLACRFLPRKDASGGVDDAATARFIGELHMDARPWRYRMNLKTGMAREEPINLDFNCEFPSVDGRRRGVKTRYAYLCDHHPSQIQWQGLRKFDTDTGAVVGAVSAAGRASWYSEPWFAPRDGATSEDDGYLIAFHWDAAKLEQELHVHDARALSAGPVARVRLPRRIPVNFHSVWANPSELRAR